MTQEEFQNEVLKRFDNLESRFDGLETKVDGLETKVDSLETKITSIDTNIKQVSTDIEAIRIYLHLARSNRGRVLPVQVNIREQNIGVSNS